MPKIKTNRAAAKRFSLTKKGKVKFKRGYLRHLLSCKSSKQKRGLRHGGILDECDARKIRALIPYV